MREEATKRPSDGATKGAGVLLALVLAFAWVGGAAGADVSVEVPAEVYAGVPFQLDVRIADAKDYQAPRIPEIPGVQIVGGPTPTTQSSTMIINGRMTQQTAVTLTWRLVAREPGLIAIPRLAVTADGETLRTRAVRVSVLRSESGDLLFLEVVAGREAYYLGETIDLELRIWLRPYVDQRAGVGLDEQDMWNQVNVQASSWGPFAPGLRQVSVSGQPHTGADGVSRRYYVYSVKASYAPTETGDLSFEDVRVLVNYPQRLGRGRGFFDRGWSVQSSRPVVGGVEAAPIRIIPTPAQGRPPSFAGAVGRFGFSVKARPTEAAVGDPITLTMTIEDVTGRADLNVIQPPPLENLEPLAGDFRIAGDAPAGLVDGSRKTFTQTIRARSGDVSRIPPIPFSYFDPAVESYVTVESDPIEVDIVPLATLSDAQIVGAGAPAGDTVTELTEVAGGILANYSGDDVLLSSQAFALSWTQGAVLLLPPGLFCVVAVGRARTRRRRADSGYERRRGARRRALAKLAALPDEPARRAEITAAALSEYVADRCNLPPGAMTPAEVVTRLEGRGVGRDLLDEVKALLTACEAMRYAPGQAGETDSVAERARACIERLQREGIR